MDTVISVDNLNYYYPGKHALCDVSFRIEKGSITALVGPNGAGKTTLLRLLAALDIPFSGSITVAGIAVQDQPRLAHAKTGYLSDDFGLYEDLLVKETLEFIAGCHRLDGPVCVARVEWVTNVLGLHDVLMQKCRTLSRGWRQRVGIAMSILHQPQVLILDEPASGLDPEARSDLSAVLKNLSSTGMTILVSSHILAELEDYCTAMLVLRDGRIQQHVSNLVPDQTDATCTLRLSLVSALTEEQELLIKNIPCEIGSIKSDRKEMTLIFEVGKSAQHQLLKKLIAADVPVCGYEVEEATLQSRYLETAKAENAR